MGAKPMTALLEAQGLRKSFGGLVATDDLSLRVEPGETLGLIGPNGAGKTTIFNLLMGELRADAGVVRMGGRDLGKLPVHARVQRGLVRTYQVPRPFAQMSVLQNIRVSMMRDNLFDMITRLAAHEAERELALGVGFDTRHFHQLPAQLAMGDLRKLELARTLATAPRVLLLDEVFAGLTVAEIARISDLLLAKRRAGLTYLIVSHDLRALEPLVDRVMVLCFGRVIADGGFAEVLRDKDVQAAYLGVGDGDGDGDGDT